MSNRKACNVSKSRHPDADKPAHDYRDFLILSAVTVAFIVFAIFNWQVFAALAVIFGFLAFLVLFGVINVKGARNLACRLGCGSSEEQKREEQP